MNKHGFANAIVILAMTFSAQVALSQRAIAFDGIENARDILDKSVGENRSGGRIFCILFLRMDCGKTY